MPTSIPKKPIPLRVLWRDSTLHIEEESREQPYAVTTIESTGFLIEKTKSHIVLAGDLMDKTGNVRRVIVIPTENILKCSSTNLKI